MTWEPLPTTLECHCLPALCSDKEMLPVEKTCGGGAGAKALPGPLTHSGVDSGSGSDCNCRWAFSSIETAMKNIIVTFVQKKSHPLLSCCPY